jgi:RNA polymerase sigma-70 factor (ECF subfamily)
MDGEPALLARAQEGDTGAFEALVELHRDRVFGLAFRMLRSEADAAEVTQDAFFSAFQHLDELRGEAAFGSWLYRIAANAAVARLRRRKVARQAEGELAAPEFSERGGLTQLPRPEWARAAEDQVLDAELGQAIHQASDALPEDHRQVFLLKDVDGLSYEQIAEVTGDSVPAIKSRLHRARLTMREAIERFYEEKS